LIAECSADLSTKVKTVPALTNSAALTLGGKGNDPGLLKVPLPAAWISFRSDQVDEQDYTHGPHSGLIGPSQTQMGTWTVVVFIPYQTDDDLIGTQFPLLEAVVSAVHGTEAPSGYRWRFIGQRIALVYPDRLAYEQRFTLTYITNSAAT
jgi:hypothetical protein